MRYELWAMEQLRQKPPCRMEQSMTCIPLRNDPICNACYESAIAFGEGGKDIDEQTD